MRKKVVWLIYDADTAIGINNEGALVFPYNLEDTDHLESGAEVYNGQKSVMWVNLRQAFYDEIKAMYQDLRSSGALSYAKVEGMFEEHQGKWPEAVFNADAWFKYIIPLVEDGNATYLSMLQGSKESQRKWWLYNRFRYIDSKYNAGDALSDLIELRGYAKGNITVTPYADIYASIKYGSYLVQARAPRGEGCTLACPMDTLNDTEIMIYSSSQLASVGDLSPLKVGRANFSNAVRLQEIKLGDADPSYSNGNLSELTLGNNPLLRRLDVRNCPNLVQAVDVSHCTGLEEAYFDGTGLLGLGLPNGGVLRKLHLPGTIANLTIRNQTKITEFVMPSYANITTLRIENPSPAIPVEDILDALSPGARVRVVGLSLDMADVDAISDFYDVLDGFRGLDENGGNVDQAQVAGTIRVPSATGAQVAALKARYPYIDIRAVSITAVLTYHNHDGSEVLGTETVSDYGDGTRVNDVARASTAQYDFTPNGWATRPDGDPSPNAITGVDVDKDVYAAYTKTLRSYTVTFARQAEDGGGTVATQTVEYGGHAVVPEDPAYAGSGDVSRHLFLGWDPDPSETIVMGDTTIYAQFSGGIGDLYAALDNGTYASEYSVGDTFPISIGGSLYTARILGIDADVDENNATIPVTLEIVELVGTMRMNSVDGNAAAWGASEARATVAGYETRLPAGARERLVAAKKVSFTSNTSATENTTQTTYDRLWIPSLRELGFATTRQETTGPAYTGVFTSDASRIKTLSGAASSYWMRSADFRSSWFPQVTGSGAKTTVSCNPTLSYGIALCFCLSARREG